MSITIRKATQADWEQIPPIYEHARAFMRQTGNGGQWGDHFPPEALLREDMEKGQLYVAEEEGQIHGSFAFIIGKDPSYARIENGSWLSDERYGTLHRVAGDGQAHGLFDAIVAFCEKQIPHLRVDTHLSNGVMRHLIGRNGFQFCGIIHVEDGTPRLAYEKLDWASHCTLCPRACGADRRSGKPGVPENSKGKKPYGVCGVSERMRIARAALHRWEEPCISGTRGSGAVFFSGCPLHCVFCQNRQISGGQAGWEVTPEELAEQFLRLQEEGAANINLVTPGHFAAPVAEALKWARNQGLTVPVICNTGGYETVETLRRWEGLVDVYLPDFKYMDPQLAARYSHAPDYPERAKEALAEMVRQAGTCQWDEEGYIRRGVIVRHLVLPGHVQDSKAVVEYLYRTYGNRIFISLMNQYTPMEALPGYPELNRKVTRREYERVVDFALELGVENGFIQEGETAQESFIPAFGDRPDFESRPEAAGPAEPGTFPE